MIKMLLISCCIFSLALAFKPCQPYGTRIFYGKVIQDSSSQQKLVIHFNTAKECNKSYVQLVKKTGLEKIDCSITSLRMSQKVQNYETFIHKCSISSINFDEEFHYNVFGWDGSSNSPIPFSQDFISVKIADITDENRKINLIVLADWSPLDKNKDKYTPLDNLFDSVLSKQQINGLLINGDVGYDLDTNNCLNYERFLVLLSATAKTIPVIMVTGNHQYNTDDNYKLFQSSFEFYNLDTELATHLEIGALYLLPFDPYQILFGKKGTKDPTFDKFDSIIKSAQKSSKFVVPISHYPLACSGTSKNCKNDRGDLKNYWNSMFDAKVSLYIGAHYHTYQRVFPYLQSNSFTLQSDNYESGRDYIVSIVEGVAGNDKDIVESIDKIEDFTASYTVNETGFGIIEVDPKEVRYTHYSTKRGVTDQITISRTAQQRKADNLSTE